MKDILLVYWSGTGNTEKMAEFIRDGIEKEGKTVEYKEVGQTSAAEAEEYSAIVLGCPSMGVEELEDSEMEPFVLDIEGGISNKKIALFGSYNWGSGEWMETWQQRMAASGAAMIFDRGLIVMDAPEGETIGECIQYGSNIAKAV